jgi:dihydrofolate reductase
MRKLISGLFMSVDGVVQSPDKWQFDVFDEDMGKAMTAHLAAEDTLLLGRKTYEEWSDYWPASPADDPYGQHINGVTKYVISDTLENVAWGDYGNVSLVRGADLAATVGQLKRQPGQNIGVAGSITLVRSLLDADLLDELVLMIHPVIAGRGKKLFEDGDDLKRLNLVSHSVTGSGVVFLTYQPRSAE